MEKELAAGHTSKARDAAVVAGIVIDKGEQLVKAAGSGSDGARPTRDETIARLRALTAELRAQAQTGG